MFHLHSRSCLVSGSLRESLQPALEAISWLTLHGYALRKSIKNTRILRIFGAEIAKCCCEQFFEIFGFCVAEFSSWVSVRIQSPHPQILKVRFFSDLTISPVMLVRKGVPCQGTIPRLCGAKIIVPGI